MVALGTCALGDSAYLSANANRPLADWTLYQSPGSEFVRTESAGLLGASAPLEEVSIECCGGP